MAVKKQIPSLSNLYKIYEEVPKRFLDETDVDICFCINILDIALIDNRIDRVSKGSNEIIFAFKLFEFRNSKNQQSFSLEEEVSVSILAAFLNTLRQFLKQSGKVVKFPAIHLLPKPKQEVGFTLLKDEILAHYFPDIKEHCNRQIRLSFHNEHNKECCFSIRKFQIVFKQNVLTENINLRHCDVHSVYENCHYIASKCGFFDSIFDI